MIGFDIVSFYGNLHPRYAQKIDDEYTTKCNMTALMEPENESNGPAFEVTYTIDDIKFLNLFDFKNSTNTDLMMCVLDRWYYFDAYAKEIDNDKFKLMGIKITELETDTDVHRGYKRKSLRLNG